MLKKLPKLKSKLTTQAVNKVNKKSTDAEVIQRVSEVQNLILQGHQRHEILRFTANKWQVSPRSTDEYIARATKNIKEINLATLQDNSAIITTALWKAFRSAVEVANISEQRQILMAIAKLKGLEQHTINHVIQDERELASLSDSELDAILVNPIEAQYKVEPSDE